MTIKTFLVQIEDTALDALKAAGHIIEGVVVSLTQQLVAKVKATDLATTAMNIISLLENHDGTGASKMDTLLGLITPAINKLEAGGGLKGLETSAEDFAREFAQSVFNDFKAAGTQVAGVAKQAAATVAQDAQPLVLGAEQALQPA